MGRQRMKHVQNDTRLSQPLNHRFLRYSASILVVLILVLGIWAEPLVAAAQLTAVWLGDPAMYIQAVLGG